jgi:hypothetical protein
MPKPANKIAVRGQEVTVISRADADFICLTDIARYKDADATDDLIRGWLRNRNTVEFLGIWEHLNNPTFNPVEFDGFRKQAGLNSFTLTPKQWIEKTGAIGIISKPGRYGGTYAHVDIAFEFASWISVEFKLYLIKEFQRLKEQERLQLGWDIKRNLAKINYRIHTDAIQANLIPPELNKTQVNLVYASEADVLNMALFGIWKDQRVRSNSPIRQRSRSGTREYNSKFVRVGRYEEFAGSLQIRHQFAHRAGQRRSGNSRPNQASRYTPVRRQRAGLRCREKERLQPHHWRQWL